MVTLNLIGFAVILLLLIGYAVVVLADRPWRSRPSVIVVLRSGESMSGVLLHRWRRHLELANVRLLTPDPTPVDGRVYIDRANVAWVQAPED